MNSEKNFDKDQDSSSKSSTEDGLNLDQTKNESREEEECVSSLTEQLNAAKEEITQLKDRYLRAMAEIENVRKRSEKEKHDAIQFGLERLMSDLLPVLDSADNAVKDISEHKDDQLAQGSALEVGFHLIRKQLVDVLSKHGLECVESEGKDFDPNHHQAIQRIEAESADFENDRVKQVFSKGYILNGRLLRPAMVSVEIAVQ